MSLFISARNSQKRKLCSLEKKEISSVLILFNNNKATCYYYLVSIIYMLYNYYAINNIMHNNM